MVLFELIDTNKEWLVWNLALNHNIWYIIYELMEYRFINLGTRLKFLFFLDIYFNIIHTFLCGIAMMTIPHGMRIVAKLQN
jgi:hypothetical protein